MLCDDVVPKRVVPTKILDKPSNLNCRPLLADSESIQTGLDGLRI